MLGTKVHGLATGCGQRGKWDCGVYLPCLAPRQRQAPIRASSTHTAKVGLTGAGSQTLWALHLVTWPAGRVTNLAGRPGYCVSGCRRVGLMGRP